MLRTGSEIPSYRLLITELYFKKCKNKDELKVIVLIVSPKYIEFNLLDTTTLVFTQEANKQHILQSLHKNIYVLNDGVVSVSPCFDFTSFTLLVLSCQRLYKHYFIANMRTLSSFGRLKLIKRIKYKNEYLLEQWKYSKEREWAKQTCFE